MKVVVWGARLGLVLGAFGVGDAMAQQQPPSAPTGGAPPPARIAFVKAMVAIVFAG